MSNRRAMIAAVLAMAVGGSAAWGEVATAPAAAPSSPPTLTSTLGTNPNPARYMFEDQIKPGMKGYGLTVMRGGKIEKFEVEVIDVIRNFGPGQNAILVRCSGLGLEHSGVIAGMSGSPVFLDEKMIGAIAFGWGAMKDPIAGVQPIRQMLNIPTATEGADTKAASGRAWTGGTELTMLAGKRPGWSALAATVVRRGGHLAPLSNSPGPGGAKSWAADDRAASLRPLATPLMVSGLSGRSLGVLQKLLDGTGLVPMASGSAGASLSSGAPLGGAADLKPGEIALEPGSALAIPLLTGDMDMSAVGTVTEVQGQKVWAFGHAMLADGPTNLPVATGYIYTIMPSLVQSFKLGASFEAQGALVSDEQTGIVALKGAKPTLVPVEVQVQTSDGAVNRTFKYQMAQHPRLSPMIMGAALTESVTAQRQLPKEFTARVTGEVTFEGVGGAEPTKINIDEMGTPESFDMESVMLPVAILTDNPFGALKLKSVNLQAKIENVNRSAVIKSVTLNKTVVAPGDQVVATLEVQDYQKAARKVEIALSVPADTPNGDYEMVVGTAKMALMQETEFFPQRFSPEDAKSLADAVGHILSYREDRLYARLVTDVRGAAKGMAELKNLPPTRVAMYASDRRTDTGPVYGSVETSVAGGGIYDVGGERFTITVDKDADKRFHMAGHGGMAGGMPNPHGGDLGPSTTKKSKAPDEGGDGGDNPFK